MLCKVCRHCGLCSGDGTFSENKRLSVELKGFSSTALCGNEKESRSSIGISLDVGTTTVALRVYTLQDALLLFEYGEKNFQCVFGSDVVSRVQQALSGDYEKLYSALKTQLSALIVKAMNEASVKLYSLGRGRAVLKKIAVCANTVMQSFITHSGVEGFSTYPFFVEKKAQGVYKAKEIFGDENNFLSECTVFISPYAGSFVGGDCLCALLSCGFFEQNKNGVSVLCDVGTNCEIVVFNHDTKDFVCTSVASGPAFEGYGISCGGPAGEGSVVNVEATPGQNGKPSFYCTVLGGVKPLSICGTGFVKAMDAFLTSGEMDLYGTLREKKVNLSSEVYITQDDVRNFQKAKASVKAGLEILLERSDVKDDFDFYLAGGFGTKLDEASCIKIGMFPKLQNCNFIHAGNAALSGASLLLFDDSLFNKLCTYAKTIKVIDLALDSSFNDLYIKALNF